MSLHDPVTTYSSAEALATTPGVPMSLVKALRVHQWIKNLLVFVPLLMAHKVFDTTSLARTAYALVAWCLCASGIYLQFRVTFYESETEKQEHRECEQPW